MAKLSTRDRHSVSLATILRNYRQTLGERMDDLRRDRELSVKDICDALKWHKSEYSRKYRGITPLVDIEIVQLRALLKAPKGWPAISTEEGLLLEALGTRTAEILARITEINALLERSRSS
jgi:transcriptional regulator with XRE-family HTH domain